MPPKILMILSLQKKKKKIAKMKKIARKLPQTANSFLRKLERKTKQTNLRSILEKGEGKKLKHKTIAFSAENSNTHTLIQFSNE